MHRLLLAAALLALPLSTSASDRLSLRVNPAVAFAPATVRVVATVAADTGNRAIEVVAESPTFYRSSRVQLDGEDAPRANQFEFRALPSGKYEVTATLIEADGHQVVATSKLQIMDER